MYSVQVDFIYLEYEVKKEHITSEVMKNVNLSYFKIGSVGNAKVASNSGIKLPEKNEEVLKVLRSK